MQRDGGSGPAGGAVVQGGATEVEGGREGVCATLAVLAWAEEVEEAQEEHVDDGCVAGGSVPEACDCVYDELEGDGADTVGWVVGFAVGGKLVGEAKVDFAQLVQVWVVGPHADMALPNGAEVACHRVLFDRVA
eukprot:5069754-Ditylum_brightwellii.AAC.1